MSEGEELVEAAGARNSIEAGMLQGLLEDAGMPCMVRSYGVNGPQLGIGLLPEHGGSQQVMVHARRLVEARGVLSRVRAADQALDAQLAAERRLEYSGRGRKPRNYNLIGAYARIWAWSLAVFAVIAGLYFLGRLF